MATITQACAEAFTRIGTLCSSEAGRDMSAEGQAVAAECWAAAVSPPRFCGCIPGRSALFPSPCSRPSAPRSRLALLAAAAYRLLPSPLPSRVAPAQAGSVPALSQIPVQLRLAESEVSSLEQPPVLYVRARTVCPVLPAQHPSLLPRLAALPFHTRRCWCPARATCTAWCRGRCACCSTCCRQGRTCRGLSTATCRSSGESRGRDAACPPLLIQLRWQPAQGPRPTLCHRCTRLRPPLPARNVPAGVLYDLVAAPTAALPWSLTIHFRTYPSK